ncbi:MAG: hypothetical protein JRF41_14895, partial [Deltaproteobacteria bacterium]|nr:hypothetical protein [Deltaproteobacteria bacterium]
LSFQSETILRAFERDVREDKTLEEKTVIPIYEYFKLDTGAFFNDKLSFHTYGWGRYDSGNSDFFERDTEGELLYGYLQYTGSSRDFFLRLGRQYVFGLALDESVDGFLINTRISPYFSLLAYGGQPIPLDDINGREGDAAFGGRIAHHLGNRYEIGLFYRHVKNDEKIDEEEIGFDLSLFLPGNISIMGRSRLNLVSDGWAEHNYEGAFNISSVQIRPFFHYFEYENFLIERENSANPFRFLAGTSEIITSFGFHLTYDITEQVHLGGKFKYYDYDRRQNQAQYLSGIVIWRGEELSEAGAELGFMNGDTNENRYYLGRAYFYKILSPNFVSGDLVYVRYQEEVLGEKNSYFASIGAGRKFMDDALEVKLSADFSSDPFFESDYRLMVVIKYLFDNREPSE